MLVLLGIPFVIQGAGIHEDQKPGESPRDMASRLALLKANYVARSNPSSVVLGADTIVIIDDLVLGKPETKKEAAEMLRLLSGRTHTVLTAIALVTEDLGRKVLAVESTDVTFGDLSDNEIEEYIETGSPFDKAGGYGIQDDRGSLFISGITGDFYNVMGLPVHRLYRLIQKKFPDLISESTT